MLGVLGVIMASLDIPSTPMWVTFVVVFAIIAAVYVWEARTAGTRPLDSKRVEKRAGVTMAVVAPIALQIDLAIGDPWWMRTLLGLAYGAPYCVAALLVLRTRR